MIERATADTRDLGRNDRQLVDLVTSVLVDPNLHTDLRMKLHRQIEELLGAAHRDLRTGCAQDDAQRPPAEPDAHPAKLLEAVLVDPNLHTDLRMRLHRQLEELLARHEAARRTT
jgi:hypothetical protein